MQKIEYVEIGKLKLHPNNPRVIKDTAFKTLCESIKANPDYFETRPILCTPKMVIFAGNMRYRAAKECGLKKVPVAIMDIPVKRQNEIMIRDNISLGEFNIDEFVNMYELKDLKSWGFDTQFINSGINSDKIDIPDPFDKDLSVIIECKDKIQQKSVYESLKSLGYKVQKLND